MKTPLLLSAILVTAALAVTSCSLLQGNQAQPLTVGSTAPRLSAPDHTGQPYSLGDAYDQGPVLIFFYPKANSFGCTRQACSLRDQFAELTDHNISVIGISTDSVQDQAKFVADHNLPFPLIADTDQRIMNAFGVPKFIIGERSSRQSFLIEDGIITWRDLSASTSDQAQDILEHLQNRS